MANSCGLLVLLLFSLAVVGCQTAATTKVHPPDFNKPDSEFARADCDVLASPFINQYAGKYVQFDAQVLKHLPQSGCCWAVAVLCAKYQPLNVYWADGNVGRPIVRFGANDPVQVFGYVLPRGAAAVVDSSKPNIGTTFGATAVLLIRMKER